MEARDIRVGSKVGGRIDKVLVREGDRVQPGQTLITFDDKELLASLDQSRAAAEKAQRGYRPEEIAEARAAAAQAKADYELRLNGYRKEDIAAAQVRRRRERPRTKFARGSIFSVTKRWRRRTWSPNSNATLPRPTGKWLWRSNRITSTNSMS